MTPIQQADLEAYLDSLPEPELPKPVCGMCRHFVPSRSLSFSGDPCGNGEAARPITAPSHCSLRALADLSCRYEANNPYAEQCPFFEEAIPF